MSKKIFSLAISLSMLLSACQPTPQPPTTPGSPQPSSSPSSAPSSGPVGTPVNLTQNRQLVAGQLLDARTGKLVTADTQLRVTGRDADKLEATSFKTQNGLFSLALKAGVNPSTKAPLHLTLVAAAEGYFNGSAQLHLSDTREAFQVHLTDRNNPPTGVGTGSDNRANTGADGSLQQTLAVNAPTQGVEAAFQLPAGTKLTDSLGQPLTGNLQTHVGFFSNQTSQSLNAFPGGFAPDSVSRNGQPAEGYFVTGGFVSVDITDSQGRKASQFSQPAAVTVQIPAGTLNPDTGKPVKAGDQVPIWSHNTETGQWTQEGTGTAQANSSGHFDVTYSVSHLSYWNLDWFYSDRCNPQLKLNWDSDNHIPVQMELLMDDANWYTHSNILHDPVNELYNVPLNKPMTFVAKYLNKEVGRTAITLGQSCGPINVDIRTADLPKMYPVELQVTLGSKTQFTRPELEALAARFGMDAELTGKILAYTHPNDPQKKFAFDEAAYNELSKLGVSDQNIQLMRALLAQTYSPTSWLGYYLDSDPNGGDWIYLEDGKANVKLQANQQYHFYGHLYYNDRYYFVDQVATLKPGETRLLIKIEDLDLTFEVVRNIMSQLGISLPTAS